MPRSNRPRRRPTSRPHGARQGNSSGPHRGDPRTGGPGPDDPRPGGWGLSSDGWRHHGLDTVQEFADGAWHVRGIPSYGALKEYRCPGCDQIIRPGVTHLVAWRADGPLSAAGAEQERRHWHRRCWEHHSPRR